MAKKVRRDTWGVIGQILAFIAGLLAILYGVNLLIDILDLSFLDDLPSAGQAIGDAIVTGIVTIIIGVVVIALEIDRVRITNHVARGILHIILGVFAPGVGLLIIIAGIFYIIDGVS